MSGFSAGTSHRPEGGQVTIVSMLRLHTPTVVVREKIKYRKTEKIVYIKVRVVGIMGFASRLGVRVQVHKLKFTKIGSRQGKTS